MKRLLAAALLALALVGAPVASLSQQQPTGQPKIEHAGKPDSLPRYPLVRQYETRSVHDAERGARQRLSPSLRKGLQVGVCWLPSLVNSVSNSSSGAPTPGRGHSLRTCGHVRTWFSTFPYIGRVVGEILESTSASARMSASRGMPSA
jgi:hypothetical protein